MRSFTVMLLIAALSVFACSSCGRGTASGGVAAARPTAVSIGGNVGRGVLIHDSPTGLHDSAAGSVFLLTARHVATDSGLFRRDVKLVFECQGGRSVTNWIRGGESRWLTTAEPGADLAWIELREGELPPMGDFACAGLESFSRKTLCGSMGNEVLVASCRDRKASFTNFVFASGIKFPGNVALLSVTQEVGCLTAKMVSSESGSPVFARSGGGDFVDLIGVVTVGADCRDEGGFVPVATAAEKIKDNFRGYATTMTRLCDCRELW